MRPMRYAIRSIMLTWDEPSRMEREKGKSSKEELHTTNVYYILRFFDAITKKQYTSSLN